MYHVCDAYTLVQQTFVLRMRVRKYPTCRIACMEKEQYGPKCRRNDRKRRHLSCHAVADTLDLAEVVFGAMSSNNLNNVDISRPSDINTTTDTP
jgi:hypothetical protein